MSQSSLVVFGFLGLVAYLGYVSIPSDSELEYVYEKSQQSQKLTEVLKRRAHGSPGGESHRRLIELLGADPIIQAQEMQLYFRHNPDQELLLSVYHNLASHQQYQEAARLLEISLEISHSQSTYNTLMNLYSWMGNSQEQVRLLQSRLQSDFSFADLRTLVGLGETKLVLQTVSSDLTRYSTGELSEVFRWSLAEQDLDLALKLYREHLHDEYVPADLASNVESLLWFARDYPALLQLKLKDLPNRSGRDQIALRHEIANLMELLGLWQEGLSQWQEIISQTPTLDAFEHAINLAENLNEPELARELAEQELRYFPNMDRLEFLTMQDFRRSRLNQALIRLQSLQKGLVATDIDWDWVSKTKRNLLRFTRQIKEFEDSIRNVSPHELSLSELEFIVGHSDSPEFDAHRLNYLSRRPDYELSVQIYTQILSRYSGSPAALYESVFGQVTATNVVNFLQSLPITLQSTYCLDYVDSIKDEALLLAIGRGFLDLPLGERAFLRSHELYNTQESREWLARFRLWNGKDPEPWLSSAVSAGTTDVELVFARAEALRLLDLDYQPMFYKVIALLSSERSLREQYLYAYSLAHTKNPDALLAYQKLMEISQRDPAWLLEYQAYLLDFGHIDLLKQEAAQLKLSETSDLRQLEIFYTYHLRQGKTGKAQAILQMAMRQCGMVKIWPAWMMIAQAEFLQGRRKPGQALAWFEAAQAVLSQKWISERIAELYRQVRPYVRSEVWSANGVSLARMEGFSLMSDSVRLGAIAQSGDRRRVEWLALEQVGTDPARLWLGKSHYNLEVGSKLRLQLARRPFYDYPASAREEIDAIYQAITYRERVRWFHRPIEISLSLRNDSYKGRAGPLARTQGMSFYATTPRGTKSYVSFSINHTALKSRTSIPSDTFFSDYSAAALGIGWNLTYKTLTIEPQISVSHDKSEFNWFFGLNVSYKNHFRLYWQQSQDPFGGRSISTYGLMWEFRF